MNTKKSHAKLRAAALAYPETCEESPWGERVVKVRGKVFVFVGLREGALHLTTKLPNTNLMALGFDFAEPCGYGLGKSGWVSARFEKGEDVPVELLLEWLDESYRAVAPRRLIKAMDGGGPIAPAKKAKKKAKKKTKARAGQVLLVGEDPLRLKRAKTALVQEGVKKVKSCGYSGIPDSASSVKGIKMIVVDLSRKTVTGIDLVADLPKAVQKKIVFTGVRDARIERRVDKAVPDRKGLFRRAPGEASVVEGLVALV